MEIEKEIKLGKIHAAEWRVKNLEYLITNNETNLRYLAGEDKTEENLKAIQNNKDGIVKAKSELIIAKQDLLFIHGF